MTAFSSRDLVGLFHPTSTHGVSSPTGLRMRRLRTRRSRLTIPSLDLDEQARPNRANGTTPSLPRPRCKKSCFQRLERANNRGAQPKGPTLPVRPPIAGNPELFRTTLSRRNGHSAYHEEWLPDHHLGEPRVCLEARAPTASPTRLQLARQPPKRQTGRTGATGLASTRQRTAT